MWLVANGIVSAAAQEQTLDVRWATDGACPLPSGLAADVAVLLGGEFPAGSLPLFSVSTLLRAEGGIEVTLAALSDQGESHRTLVTADCREASQAAAMLIALAITPEASSINSPQEPTPPPPKEPEPKADAQDELEEETSSPAGREPQHRFAGPYRSSWGLSVMGGLDVGLLPAPALYVAAGGLWSSHLLRLELQAAWTGPSEASLAGLSGVAIKLFAISALGRGCVLGSMDAFKLGPCFALRGGYVHGRANGVQDGQPSSAPWLSAGLDARIEWYVAKNVAIQLTWGMEAGLLRPVFRIRNADEDYVFPAINTLGGLGIALSL